jgi:hypothetical protein
MKSRRTGAILTGFAALALAVALPARAQTKQQAPAKAEGARGVPDFSGVWEMPPEAYEGYDHSFSKDELPMTAWGKQRYDAAKPSEGPRMVPTTELNDPFYKCLPPGVPRIYLHPMGMQIVQTPSEVLQLFEYDHLVRHIRTDQRKHNDPDPTWMGDAIGRWEGSTLVVDSIGYNDKSWIDRVGHPHSSQLHVIERFRRVDAKTIRLDLTLEDPIAYTRPIIKQFVFRLQPTWRILEHVCVDNGDFLEFDKKETTPDK